MSKPTVDRRIWEILRRYEDKLTFEERSDVACKLDDLFDEVKKPTQDFDRLMTLESEVLRQCKLIKDLTDHLYFESSRINEQDDKLEKLDDLGNLTSDVNKAGVLCRAVGDRADKHTGQIAELTEQVKILKESLEAMKTSHTRLKKCIEEFSTNVYLNLM